MSRHISKTDLAKVKKLDLLTYFMNYEPDELIHNSSKDYITNKHGYLHIEKNTSRWFYCRTQVYGKSALDYFIKVENWNFLDAALYLNDLIKKNKPIKVTKDLRNNKIDNRFQLPKPNGDNTNAINYLTQVRKIDKDIVQYMIEHYYIYESKNHDVVFVGYDEMQKGKFACIRSTNSNIKRDVLGSNKEYSFAISYPSSNVLHVFESAIDLLSYLTLLKQKGERYLEDNYLSLSGVGGKHSPALTSFLKRHGNIQSIHLHLDNDDAGIIATNEIINKFKSKYYIFDEHIKQCKDINEYLMNKEIYEKV